MAIIKCKMCGGDLLITEGSTVAECEYCCTAQTIPSMDDEKKLSLFARANRLRAACEFDKAEGIYESIVSDFPEEAEAYWGLVLCRYGIEYVDDPATGKKIPTCHRSSFQCVMDDPDFEQVMENADAFSRRIYREEARAIEQLRKDILSISSREQPYDIFICYKETDPRGERTLDSVLAQDIYDALTGKGYRVFFSRITLEDKLGQEYEPYIFSALNSAKVMLVVGTDYEYFQAVWVKNEWSRFLKLMEQDKTRCLIPCYKGIDAYDMPKEFLRLQGQDLGKLGAIQDLLRGIGKLIPKETVAPTPVAEPVIAPTVGGVSLANLLKRAEMALEDERYSVADDFCEQVLNMDVENGEAYLYKFMAAAKIPTRDCIRNDPALFFRPDAATERDAARARRFANGVLSQWLDELQDLWDAEQNRQRLEEERRQQEEAERRIQEALAIKQRMKEQEEERLRIAQAEAARQASRKRLQSLQGMLSTGYHWAFSACTKLDGTVLVADKPKSKACLAMQWKNMAAVSVENYSLVGLTKNGTVVSQKVSWLNSDPLTLDWKDIIAISKGDGFTLGLKADGRVLVSAGEYSNVSIIREAANWTDIIAISAGNYHAVGLKRDGSVVAAGETKHGECDVSGWNHIIAVSAGSEFTVGLRSDGTVVAVGDNVWDKCSVSGWQDVVAISAGIDHTLGLTSDGRILLAGGGVRQLQEITYLQGFLAISAGYETCMALREDGTVVVIGKMKNGRSNLEGVNLFDSLPPEQRRQFSRSLIEAREDFFK